MYSQKVAKRDKARAEPYTIFNPHDRSNRDWDNLSGIVVVSIDPGYRNLAIRVERRPWGNRDLPIEPLLFEVVDFGAQREGESWDLHPNILKYLEKNRRLLETASVVVVERQMAINYNAVRISQLLLTYFMMILRNKPNLPLILELDPKTKGKALGAPKSITKPALKKWATEKAREILTARGDVKSINQLNSSKKKDDLGDTIVQVEALFIHMRWV